MVLGDGTLVKASKTENTDLYYALPWSHGSLGLLVGLTLDVVPVTEYVKVEYAAFPNSHPREYSDYIRDVSLEEDAADFVEATVYDKNSCVVMTGRFENPTTPEEKAKINQAHSPEADLGVPLLPRPEGAHRGRRVICGS